MLGGIAIWLAGGGITNTRPMPRPEFGWAEFWLNRYQTSLAALIALAAAFAAARPAWKQLRELTRQSEQRTYADRRVQHEIGEQLPKAQLVHRFS